MKVFPYFLFLLALAAGFTACGQKGGNAKAPAADIVAMWDQMMVVHDAVMPKMSDISRLKKQLRADSANLDLITKLTKAEDGMWAWMHELTPLSKLEEQPTEAAVQYLRRETARIEGVSKMMMDGIREAEDRLGIKQ